MNGNHSSIRKNLQKCEEGETKGIQTILFQTLKTQKQQKVDKDSRMEIKFPQERRPLNSKPENKKLKEETGKNIQAI